jgi:hypothetical protein
MYVASFPGLMEAIDAGPSATLSWIIHYCSTTEQKQFEDETDLDRELQDLWDSVPFEFLEGLRSYVRQLHAARAEPGMHGGH